MKNIDEVFQYEQGNQYNDNNIKILYQIQRVEEKCKSSDDESDGFQEVELAGYQSQAFQIFPIANAVIK